MSQTVEESLRARVRQQAVVAGLGQRALAEGLPERLLGQALREAAEALGAPLGKVLACEGDRARLIAALGLTPDAVVEARPGSQLRFVLDAGEAVLIEDLTTDPRFEPEDLLLAAGAVSGISAAVYADGGVPWGVIGVYDTRHRFFSTEDLHFMQAVANVLTDALVRAEGEARLRESEAYARAVLETTVDGIITIDARGRITAFNPAAERIFGYAAAEVIGENVRVLMPDPYHAEHDDYLRSHRETGRRKIIGIGREVTGRRADGSTFPMDLAVSEVHLESGRVFTGIVRDISERRRLEQEVLRISDDERRRIGQDLHDDLGQQLTGVGLIARSLARRLAREAHPAAEIAEDITRLIREADEQARRLARGLVPVELGADGLVAALQRLASNAEALFGITCAFEQAIESPRHLRDAEVVTHLYRIAQEAVSNAVRHGAANHVSITLMATPERLRLRIRDDGQGITEEALGRSRSGAGGMGLRIMHHRARIIGGSLDVRSGPDGGTVVTCTFPPSTDSSSFPSTPPALASRY